MRNKLLVGLLMTFAGSAQAATSVNLLANGGFESYDVTNSYAHIASDCSGVSAPCIEDTSTWQPLATSPNEFLEIKDNFSNINAYEGSNYAELVPVFNSTISQTFQAQAGFGNLSWWDHGRYGVNYEYQVQLNGSTIFDGLTASFDNWTERSFLDVNLLDGDNTLLFISKSTLGNTMGANVDAISVVQSFGEGEQEIVSAVPEAETYFLMLVGFSLFAAANRRQKVKVR